MKISEPNKRVLKKLWKNKLTVVSAAYILLCILIATFAYQIIPDKTKNANAQNIEIAIKKPGFKINVLTIDSVVSIPLSEYLQCDDTLYYTSYDGDEGFTTSSNYTIKSKRFVFGTDKFGRDVFSRLILGTRISLSIGIVAVMLSLVIGVFFGSMAGYFRGRIDKIIMWLINVVWSIPSVLLVIAISFALGRGFWQVFVAVGLSLWVDVARLVRGQVISIKEQEYVDSAKTLGFGSFRIITKHILPNIVGPLLVISASNFASAILLEAGLSFLGIGVQPPMASWGTMIKESYAYLILGDPYLSLIPGIAIVLIVLAFMLLGNGLRDALDVK